jgi:hypothetical protein
VKYQRRQRRPRGEALDTKQYDHVIASFHFAVHRAVQPCGGIRQQHRTLSNAGEVESAEPVDVRGSQRPAQILLPLPKKLNPSRGAVHNRDHRREPRITQIDTSGGSKDTEEKELITNPTGLSSKDAHTTVTPVGKQPKVWRSNL